MAENTGLFTRRQALTAGAGSLAAVASVGALAGCASSSESDRPLTVGVVVVGAGLAGLTAARELVRGGMSVVVLEASDHVGGRCVRTAVNGGWIDRGGQWAGPGQTEILKLAQELGVTTFDSYEQGDSVLYYDNKRSTFSGDLFAGEVTEKDFPGRPPADIDAATALFNRFDRLSRTVNVEQPWNSPNAPALDSQTWQTWIESNTPNAFARFAMNNYCLNDYGEPASEISLLKALVDYKAAPGEDPEAFLFDGGAGQIPERLAEELRGKVILNHPVLKLRQNDREVGVITADKTFRAGHVVVAVPPAISGYITYEPVLPAARGQVVQRAPMGEVVKIACTYPSAWWRGQGLSGEAVGDLATCYTADSSQPSGTPGILTSFLVGAPAIQLATPDERRAVVMDNVVKYFGPQAANPTQYIETNWPGDPWVRGAYSSFYGPGVLSIYRDALTAPFGRIHWAGSETSALWTGYMDGAVRSGQNAAKAILSGPA